MVRSGQSGFVFKLDYEKAYDMVDRSFLLKMMAGRGFSPHFLKLVKSLLDNGSVGVRINDVSSDFFISGRGVRQGDPSSPILFNPVADVFTKMLIKAANNDLISSLLHGFERSGVIILHYAYDTLLFLQNDRSGALNLKWLLSCFEQMSGLRINFHKCDLVPINVPEEGAQVFAHILSCKFREFPLQYLGVPLHHTRLRREDLQPLVDKLIEKAAGWRGRRIGRAHV